MAFLPSATTVYANAYLTELGRQYLFDSPSKPRYKTMPDGTSIDLLKIERFSFGDPDINYNIPVNYLPISGDIIDITGESENAITGCRNQSITDLISPGDTNLPSQDISLVEYKTTAKEIKFDLSKALDTLQTVFTQQLKTFVDGKYVYDGLYEVTPTNYGKIKVQNGELIIPIAQPTATENGYRLRIFYPTIGTNFNKMTFQFESSPPVQSAVITNTWARTIATS